MQHLERQGRAPDIETAVAQLAAETLVQDLHRRLLRGGADEPLPEAGETLRVGVLCHHYAVIASR
jgi:hypothetical protein